MTARPTRCGIVDLGSNSVRLVVYEGESRNPQVICNEKAVLRLGRGLQASGRLDEDAVAHALVVVDRYTAIARAMRCDPFEILATAAVRDAENGQAFVEILRARLGHVAIRILSGNEEAALSAEGVACGVPYAEGILADLGGGSLELVRLRQGRAERAETLPLGIIRLSERAGDPIRARAIATEALAAVPWLSEGAEGDLFVVGGAWRALARIHMAQTAYPLGIVHHYTVEREEARDLAGVIAAASRRALERLPGVQKRRIDDLPYAAVLLRRLLRATGARRVVFSANGLREGWYMQQIAPAARAEDPLLSAAAELGQRCGRDADLPGTLSAWMQPLFEGEPAEHRRLREAACLMSDLGARDHPEYRAEQAFFRVLRQPGIGLDHHARAFLALTVALRYEAEPDAPFLAPARALLDMSALLRAETLGSVLRLAYTLCAGAARMLSGTTLALTPGTLTLTLDPAHGSYPGDGVTRRLERLAASLAREATIMVPDGGDAA